MAIFSPWRAIAERPGAVRGGMAALIAVLGGEVEELAPPPHAFDARDQQLEVLGVVDEVEPLAVDDEKRRVVVLVEVAAVRIGESREIDLRDRPLVVDAAPVHAR